MSDPQAEVIALSPKTLMATNRFLCEVCGKGFQRDQNLQLHRRGHNLPWKLKQRDGQEIKKRVYVCPETTCVHHHPSRALGDLTGIKKHFSRKHGEKKWKCEKCSKRYAVHSDWKAHQKVCGTREYRCDCGTVFSRRDSFITHRAFCEALVQENARMSANQQVETRQLSGLDGNVLASPAGELSSATETAPSSPLSQHTTSEHINAELLEPLVRDIWEPNATLNEARVIPSTSRSVQGGLLPVTLHTPSAGPGLSLCLGTGLGPGPPCMSERINCLSQAGPTPASKQMNKLVGAGSQRDESTQWQLPLASAGIFTSMLTAANSDLDSQGYTSNGMAGLSMGINSVIGSSSASSQFAKSTFLESGFVLSKHPSQHAGSVQLPATTLLQKAAMMGSTKSSSFMFRNIGLGGEDLGSLSTRESQQHDSWAGSTSSLSSSWRTSLSMKPAAEGFPGCGEIGAGGSYSTSYGRQDNVQEFRDSGGAPRLEDVSHVASSSLNMAGDFMHDCNRNYHHVGCGGLLHEGSRTQYGTSCTELEGSQRGDRHEGFRIQEGISCTELEGSQRGDRHEANRLTLDFLGLGGHSRSVGVAMGTGEDLFQKDTVSINLLNAGIKPEPLTYLEENMGARIERDSPLSEG